MIVSPDKKGITTEQLTNELSLLGMNNKINELQKEFEKFKDGFLQLIEHKLEEAIKNRDF